jgi:hypothetical protein
MAMQYVASFLTCLPLANLGDINSRRATSFGRPAKGTADPNHLEQQPLSHRSSTWTGPPQSMPLANSRDVVHRGEQVVAGPPGPQLVVGPSP